MSRPEEEAVKKINDRNAAALSQYESKEERSKALKTLNDGTGESSMSKEERQKRRGEVGNQNVDPGQVKMALAADEKKGRKKSGKK